MAEPTLTDVMNAIGDLGRHLTGRIDATNGRIDATNARIDALQLEMREGFASVRTEIRVVDARLDEQRHTLNALIPTRIAAVPPAAE